MRERIIDAATALFARKGYYQTSMDDVAEFAGVAKGSLYYHFKNKSQLFCEAALEGFLFLGERLRGITAQDAAPSETADRIITFFVDICFEYRGFTDMIMNEMSAGIDADVLQTVRQAREIFLDDVVQVLDEGQRAGAIRPCDSRCAAGALVSFIYAYCRKALEAPGAGREDVAAGLGAVLLHGLLA